MKREKKNLTNKKKKENALFDNKLIDFGIKFKHILLSLLHLNLCIIES